MKKTLLTGILSLTLAAACTVGFAACGSKHSDPIYNKTYTITGSAHIDWDTKDYYDNYTQDDSKAWSQRELLEKNWDAITWDATLEWIGATEDDIKHGNVDELIASYDKYLKNFYEQAKGLAFSFSSKDDLKLTLSLPANWMEDPAVSDYYESTITMPFYETREAFAADLPYEGFSPESIGFNEGYSGAGGFKTGSNHVLVVKFFFEEYRENLQINITDYTLTGDPDNPIDSLLWLDIDFYPRAFQTFHYEEDETGGHGSAVLSPYVYTDFEVTDNK